ncbi:hypothetical protein LAZ67_2000261 [Cordylochernes scorpioides]|uniref:Mos1 transposase HTH domain-containing protein n=1 Tax=Cordylochernes scorpioides TaxID=51811 RepID=A0ABY6K0N0_9ARAC|nr:hypothetical protein LAZ67_2000261 [Cordylochernes scorpioides]
MKLPLVSPASCESRSVIRFLAAKNNSAKDIHTELCQVYGEGCMSSGMVRRWVREFKNGRTDDHDEPRAGRPSVSEETIAKVEAAMLEDRRFSKVCAIWVPKMLTEDHKRQRVDAAQKFPDCHKTDGEEFLDSIVTGDVTWVHYTTPETKEQSKEWKHTSSPKPLTFKQTLSAGKLIATNKRRETLTKGVRFHHDNARPHTAHQTTALIEEFEWELVSHPPHVAPSDFHLFPELKKNLGGTQFQDDDELEEAVLGFYAARRQSSLTLGSIRCGEFSSTSLHLGGPLTVLTEYRQSWSRQSGKLGNVHTKNEDTVALGKFREQIKVELGAKDGDEIVLTGLHGG